MNNALKQIGDEFFTEEQTSAVHFSLRIRNKLISRHTLYQHLEIVETEEFGRLMALDGKIMLTERDEHFYHEMLVHPAMLAHMNPKCVLVIGGGDGGTVREVLQHPSVERVFWAEIDEEVVIASRQYLPSVCAHIFEDPRVELHIRPGEQLVKEFSKTLDIIIVDSTDPLGPAIPLFEPSFFKACDTALHPDGIFVTQCGSPFFSPEHVRITHQNLRPVFLSIRFYLGFVPCYPSMWSYCLGSRVPLETGVDTVSRRYQERALRVSYFTPRLYQGSTILPKFVADLLD
jgi:spermidine synthase